MFYVLTLNNTLGSMRLLLTLLFVGQYICISVPENSKSFLLTPLATIPPYQQAFNSRKTVNLAMKIKEFLTALVCLLLINQAQAQQPMPTLTAKDQATIRAYEDSLGVLGYAVVNDSSADNRFAACRAMIIRLKQALKTPGSFAYPFSRLKNISIQYPQDSAFRIFTWQLYVDKDEYRYFGAIQLNSHDLQLIPLQDRSFTLDGDLEQLTLGPDKWYGAVYYNVMQVDSPIGPYYLLFGFDGYQFFFKRKVVDVLRIEDGQAVFGAPVFQHAATESEPAQTKHRIVKEYSAAATVRLNYDPTHELIMFDHLIAGSGQYGEGVTFYPDGSYEGYRLEKGVWQYVPKVFQQVSAEPPRDYPVLDERKDKNIFGKKGKN